MTRFGSAWPMIGTSEASHCWNGCATKYPSSSNQRGKGAEIFTVCQGEKEEGEVRIVRLYTGVFFFTCEDIEICPRQVRSPCWSVVRRHLCTHQRTCPLSRKYLALLHSPDPIGQCGIEQKIYNHCPQRQFLGLVPAKFVVISEGSRGDDDC